MYNNFFSQEIYNLYLTVQYVPKWDTGKINYTLKNIYTNKWNKRREKQPINDTYILK